MTGTFVTGRWNEEVDLRGRLTRACAFAAMGSGIPVDRVRPNSTHNRLWRRLEGVPSPLGRFQQL